MDLQNQSGIDVRQVIKPSGESQQNNLTPNGREVGSIIEGFKARESNGIRVQEHTCLTVFTNQNDILLSDGLNDVNDV